MRTFMTCPYCGGEYSVTPGDYWHKTDDKPFLCECGEPMQLVRRIVTYEVLSEVVTMDTLEEHEKGR